MLSFRVIPDVFTQSSKYGISIMESVQSGFIVKKQPILKRRVGNDGPEFKVTRSLESQSELGKARRVLRPLRIEDTPNLVKRVCGGIPPGTFLARLLIINCGLDDVVGCGPLMPRDGNLDSMLCQGFSEIVEVIGGR